MNIKTLTLTLTAIVTIPILGCDPQDVELSESDRSYSVGQEVDHRFVIELDAEWAREFEFDVEREILTRDLQKFDLLVPDRRPGVPYVGCFDPVNAPKSGKCLCLGVADCKSDRWLSACVPKTEKCEFLGCTCSWKK